MVKRLIASAAVFAAGFTSVKAAHHGKTMPTKKAILLVAFGTSKPHAKKSFTNIERLAKERFPNTEIRWGFTSKIIRRKLAKQGEIIDSPQLALAKLADEGYTHVAAQSLHSIPGEEYHEVVACVKRAETLFQKVTVGAPLLKDHKSTERAMKALLEQIPSERKADEAVILMGHGTEHHPADIFYTAADAILKELDPKAYMGSVEGYNTIDIVLTKCKRDGIHKAWLIPFMSVAGDHAMNDMASDDQDSWKSILTKDGIQCEIIMKGTAEFDSIVNIWLDNLEIALTELND